MMTNFCFFVKKGFYLLAIVAIFMVAIFSRGYLVPFRSSIIIGFLISLVNYGSGAAIISWGYDKPQKQFFSAFLGGMLVRFLLMFLAILIAVIYFELNKFALVFSLFFGYFSFLVIEIWGVLRFSDLKGNQV